MFEVENAHSPKFNATGTISMMVKFSHLTVEIPFTASPDDVEAHGRDIHARALSGEFGEVAEYVPPSDYEIALAEAPRRIAEEMKAASDNAIHSWMMGDEEKANEWRAHYQELSSLQASKAWPMVAMPAGPA